MSKTLFLTRAADVRDVAKGHTWESKPMRASLWRLMLYAIATGDWNPVHINPLTAWLYKSNLGGLTYCADLVLAITKAGFQRMIRFQEQPETVADGYEKVEFNGPVRVGMKFYYRFVLEDREVRGRGSAKCTWKFEVIEYGTNKVLYVGRWISWYMLVKPSREAQTIRRAQPFVRTGLECAAVICVALVMASSILSYHPLNEYCYPWAP